MSLEGMWYTLTRVLWILLAIAAVFMFLTSLPGYAMMVSQNLSHAPAVDPTATTQIFSILKALASLSSVLISFVLAGLLFIGCSRSIDEEGVSVSENLVIGMLRAEVAASLRAAGATESQGAYVPSDPTGLEDGDVWDLEDGSLLEVSYARDSESVDFVVTSLSICFDPSVPVGLRVWEDLAELAL